MARIKCFADVFAIVGCADRAGRAAPNRQHAGRDQQRRSVPRRRKRRPGVAMRRAVQRPAASVATSALTAPARMATSARLNVAG